MAIVVAFCAAGYFGYKAYETATMTDQKRFMLANIEALTDPELTYDDYKDCCWSPE